MCLTANAAVGDILVPGDPEGKDALQVGEEGLQCDHPEMGVNGLLEVAGRDQPSCSSPSGRKNAGLSK